MESVNSKSSNGGQIHTAVTAPLIALRTIWATAAGTWWTGSRSGHWPSRRSSGARSRRRSPSLSSSTGRSSRCFPREVEACAASYTAAFIARDSLKTLKTLLGLLILALLGVGGYAAWYVSTPLTLVQVPVEVEIPRGASLRRSEEHTSELQSR